MAKTSAYISLSVWVILERVTIELQLATVHVCKEVNSCVTCWNCARHHYGNVGDGSSKNHFGCICWCVQHMLVVCSCYRVHIWTIDGVELFEQVSRVKFRSQHGNGYIQVLQSRVRPTYIERPLHKACNCSYLAILWLADPWSNVWRELHCRATDYWAPKSTHVLIALHYRSLKRGKPPD
jgi:hypothetical protein